METIYVIRDGKEQAFMVRMNGDVPEVKIGDNYYCPLANGGAVERIGLKKPTPQMIIQHPEVWLHLGLNEGGREVTTRAEYDARRRAIYEAKEAKLNAAVPGLKELRAAHQDIERYHAQFERMMEDEGNDGVRPPKPINGDIDALRAQYPVAAAYLKAEAWSYATHYAKATAGERAMERIANGDNYTSALTAMEAEWSAHCNEHIWD